MPDTGNTELPSPGEMAEQRDRLPERAHRKESRRHGPDEPSTGHRTGLVNWKVGCLVAVTIIVALVGACGVWAYRELRPQDVEIHNDTGEGLLIHAEPYDICPREFIGAHSKAVYTSRWRCARPRIRFMSPLFLDVECSWRDARARQPVVVRPDLVSCQDAVPMPVSPP